MPILESWMIQATELVSYSAVPVGTAFVFTDGRSPEVFVKLPQERFMPWRGTLTHNGLAGLPVHTIFGTPPDRPTASRRQLRDEQRILALLTGWSDMRVKAHLLRAWFPPEPTLWDIFVDYDGRYNRAVSGLEAQGQCIHSHEWWDASRGQSLHYTSSLTGAGFHRAAREGVAQDHQVRAP
ncbi:MAG TPA: hypothetical protein VLF67_03405 [Candidatus Saccharimonas sp.]|nr:hypothetical protein [Candidatus Saccharimonas sp.]